MWICSITRWLRLSTKVADGAIAEARARQRSGFFAGTLMSHSTGNVAASSTTTQEAGRFPADFIHHRSGGVLIREYIEALPQADSGEGFDEQEEMLTYPV